MTVQLEYFNKSVRFIRVFTWNIQTIQLSTLLNYLITSKESAVNTIENWHLIFILN